MFPSLFLNKNTHTCRRNTIEIYEREKKSKMSSSILTQKIHTHENKWEMLTSFIIWKSLGTPHTLFQNYHPGTFMLLSMQYRRGLLIFSCVLNLTS